MAKESSVSQDRMAKLCVKSQEMESRIQKQLSELEYLRPYKNRSPELDKKIEELT